MDLPIQFILKGKEISHQLIELVVSETLYSPLQIRCNLQLLSDSEQTYLDSILTLILKGPHTEHNDKYHCLRERKYIGIVTQEERHFVRNSRGIASVHSHLLIESPLALLTRGRVFHIFSNEDKQIKLKDVFSTVLDRYKSAFQGELNLSYKVDKLPDITIEYLVQYAETDFDFIQRLCEDYGIGYFQQGNTLEFLPGIKLCSRTDAISLNYEHIRSWTQLKSNQRRKLLARGLLSGKRLHENEEKDETFTVRADIDGPSKQYDATFQLNSFSEEDSITNAMVNVWKNRIEHTQSGIEIHSSRSGADIFPPLVGLRVGDKVRGPITPLPEQSGGVGKLHTSQVFLVEEVSWFFAPSSNSGEGGEHYDLEARLCRTDIPYAPPKHTPSPKISGLLRAKVIAPRTKEEAEKQQKLGRIKVQFLWDTMKASDRKPHTCWVRLSSLYMGEKHGFYVMPEVNDEVLVAFEGGDVNRPVVIGSVPNRPSNFISGLTKEPRTQLETIAIRTPEGFDFKVREQIKDQKPIHDMTLELGEGLKVSFGANAAEQKQLFSAQLAEDTVVHLSTSAKEKKRVFSIQVAEGMKVDLSTEKKKQELSIEMAENLKMSVVSNAEDKKQLVSLQLNEQVLVNLSAEQEVTASLSSEGSIQVSAEKGVKLSSKKILELQCAAATIQIKEDGSIAVKGSTISLEADNLIEIKAGQIKLN